MLEAVEACIAAGAPGITVHPRADRRHITPDDVRAIARLLGESLTIELNVEGDPRPELLDLVEEVQADQCTLVPVVPGEVTSQAGWQIGSATEALPGIIARLRARGCGSACSSMRRPIRYVGPPRPARTASSCTPSRSRARSSRRPIRAAARSHLRGGRPGRALARTGRQRRPRSGSRQPHGISRTAASRRGVDRPRDHLARALFVGLATVVREYLDVLRGAI